MSKSSCDLVSAIIGKWRNGERPDTRKVVSEHPHLLDSKSKFVDLAYEEYCQRTAAGERLDPHEFCRGFSKIQASLGRRLEVHELLRAEDALLAGVDDTVWPEIGDTICGYTLREELGRGMVGRVFLAEDQRPAKRQVVVKLTRAGVHEAEILNRLQHTNIVPVYSTEYEELSGLTVICMPYVGRHTLQDLLDVSFQFKTAPELFEHAMQRLDVTIAQNSSGSGVSYVDAVVKIGVQLCEALTHSHARGVCHLDLKPSNVLLGSSGKALLIDFNLSSDTEARWSLLGGTLPYMSPEQIRSMVFGDRQVKLDGRSDTFSLAVMLYQLLTGKHPFAGINWHRSIETIGMELLSHHRAGVKPAKQLNTHLSSSLSQLLASAMAADPADRPASAEEFGALLRREFGFWARQHRFLRRHRILAASLAAVAMLGLATSGTLIATREPYASRESAYARALVTQGKYEEALASYTRVIQVDPHNYEAYFARGRIYQRLAKFDEAYDDFSQAHSYVRDGRFSACRGFSAAALGKNEVALARYQEAIDEGFATKEVYVCQGRICLRLKQRTPAELAFRKALELDRGCSVAWHNLALLQQSVPEGPALARESIDQALLGDSPSPEACVAGALFAWLESGPRAILDIHHYLERGSRLGLTWDECLNKPFVRGLSQDSELIRSLKSNPKRRHLLLLNPDPLGDAEISRLSLMGISR